MELKRHGYGSNFNKLFIDISLNTIRKECFHSDGMKKIRCEISFLQFLIDNKIQFPIPLVHEILPNGYVMGFMQDYIPLYQIYKSIDQTVLPDIMEKLMILHSYDKRITSHDVYLTNLLVETRDKIYERFKVTEKIVSNYSVKSVNGVQIYAFDYIIESLNNRIIELVGKKKEFYFVPIHGDCQFNNVLIHTKTNCICFIDPRGYYGNMEIYGIEEYDFAKVLFALSGYDHFDNSDNLDLNIDVSNIIIQTNILDPGFLKNNNLETLIMLTIWLGNAHCFAKNEKKAAYSYFIAVYYATLFLNKHSN
jgi:hypothetical protein